MSQKESETAFDVSFDAKRPVDEIEQIPPEERTTHEMAAVAVDHLSDEEVVRQIENWQENLDEYDDLRWIAEFERITGLY